MVLLLMAAAVLALIVFGFVGLRRNGADMRGLAAPALYLLFVGIGHIALALYWYDQTTGRRRDGQAFSLTMLLGVGLLLFGVVAAIFTIAAERDRRAVVLGALIALGVAVAVVGYTASQGYATEPIIIDGRADVVVILRATLVAYALSHIAGRLIRRRSPKRVMPPSSFHPSNL